MAELEGGGEVREGRGGVERERGGQKRLEMCMVGKTRSVNFWGDGIDGEKVRLGNNLWRQVKRGCLCLEHE